MGPVQRYLERAPRPELAGLLHCVWTLEAAEGRLQRVIPDGCIDLIWINGELQMVGPDTVARVVGLPPGTGVAGVRMLPGAAPLLLGEVPTSELLDLQVSLPQLWGRRGRALADRLAGAESPTDTALRLERFAVEMLPGFERDRAVEAAVAALDGSQPPSVPELADALGLSERHFRRRFTSVVGYGPKTLAGVLRMRRAMRLDAGAAGGLAGVAGAVGYADQAHMNREFRRLSGLTPADLLDT
ncbi:AraC family transcriptional regulator [Saccharopolyspora erythraea NRRL 2338]|uniref:AraC family transcriptional regulator n=2 Tax=Saccharopolyspora erythraea TaxID=1836 RepID=A4F9K5_SACEN|nr:helix-turn-helix transcriptional regulator [Saccharopolyspora erythraea]EQD87387.1 AraC family transcriptional regulator [Saccharopolyspora erythraea D]PFG94516.1 AraC family transcriptional regulator [Saccharopolyspora erythraea NRRL 2338]CAM00730.1 AraC family transcriptional regulator [Saccharopolyspora erythraea NRRL 2338]